jgi:hypothetical protein
VVTALLAIQGKEQHVKDNVESIADWQALPQPSFPSLKTTEEKGSIYTVHKVGFLAADPKDCARAGIECKTGSRGKCYLPTAFLEFAGDKQLVRLPFELTSWVLTGVTMTGSGASVFPTEVEFGVLNGRTYAEML